MMDYGAFQAVAAVVKTGSFEKAAALLCVTPSAVSQRVKSLEERLGTVLVIRSQPCTASHEGELICRHVEQVLILEDGLIGSLPAVPAADKANKVTIPLAVNSDSLATWFLEAASTYSAETGYLFDVIVDDQDHTAEILKAGRALGAITADAEPVPGFKSYPLGAMTYHAVASPVYRERFFPEGVTAASLSDAPAIVFNRKDRLQEIWTRELLGRSVSFPNHWLPSSHAFIDACLLGMGWGMSPLDLLHQHLSEGTLVDLSPDHPVEVPLFWQVKSSAAASLRRLTDILMDCARQSMNGRG